MKRAALALLLLLILGAVLPSHQVVAQDETTGAYYVIQEGDNLWDIALRFGVSMDALVRANGISDAGQISVGMHLKIPGLEGMQGELVTRKVGVGENLTSLSRQTRTSIDVLARLNHLSSPAELYAGASLILLQNSATTGAVERISLAPGQSLLELSVLRGENPWKVAISNDLPGISSALPGDVFLLPGNSEQGDGTGPIPGALPDAVASISIEPLPLVQGKTTSIKLDAPAGLTLSGSLAGYDLRFFPDPAGGYAALQGVHALAEPGLYTFVLTGTLSNGTAFSFDQTVFLKDGDYLIDPPLTVSPETIDPAVTQPEEAQWLSLVAGASPEKLWEGIFLSPAPPPFDQCWPSLYGNRRSYNGSAYNFFHTGLDFCGGIGNDILAPAAGQVIFAGPLTVRGNATIIDHGWGVYTGYMHQSEILVKVGDRVEKGQLIGRVGGTGRVTGPHLHWEVFVGGVQVQPMDWLQREFP